MRRLVLAGTACLALGSVLLRTVPPVSRAQTRAAERSTPGNLLVNVRFALTDREPGDWSGRLEVQGGRVEKLEGWHFPPAATQLERGPAAKCAITGPLSWRAQSQGDPPNRVHVDLSPIVPSPRPTWPLGLLVFLTADERTRLTLKFEKQPAVAFAVAELERGPARFNDNAVEAERLPRFHYVGGDNGEADYPSVTVAPDGAIWVAWQEYRAGSDRVLARRYSNGTWDSPVTLAENTDAYRTAVAQAGDSRVWVVWAAQANGEWALWGRSFDGRAWDAPQKLSTTPGPNMHHSLVADGQGNLWLAWQGFDHGQSDIFLRIYRSGRWGPVVRVSESSANDWEPSVAVDRAGRGWIAWDTYVAGNYDVLARSVMPGGTLGPVVSVASSPRFEAHASVAVDPRGRIWVAFDESGENWGKDWGFLSSDRGMALYMIRSLRVVCVDPSSGRSCGPEQPIQDALPPDMQLYASLPSIHADGSGRICVVFRYLAGARTRTMIQLGMNGGWENAVISYADGRWSRAVPLPRSIGRNDGRPAIAAGRAGLLAAYASDHRPFLTGAVQDYAVYLAEVGRPADAEGSPVAAALPAVQPSAHLPAQLPAHPRESDDIRRMREYRLRLQGQTFRIVRGDLHRHTDISSDGLGDGSLLDLYRYGLDAASLDFIAVTDHNAGADQEYSWWRTQKSNDLFLVPGAFTPLYGYERSVPYPNGHRNIVFDHRGVRTLPISAAERQGEENAARLYRYLKDNDGIAFTHTTATDQGTDWRDNDPNLEPVTEIYQGFRNSYEHEGAPKAASFDRPFLFKAGYRPLGFYWNALAKGYKLGIQASSDHMSTHLSYACLYVTGLSRRELLDALRARRCYGATDNILLDCRLVEPDGTEHLMGASVALSGQPRLKVHAIGAGPIERVDVVKNNRYVYAVQPGQAEVDFTFSDPEAAPGQSWYYVRVRQYDGALAWSSPVWVKR